MTKMDAIKNRTLSKHDMAVVNAMAQNEDADPGTKPAPSHESAITPVESEISFFCRRTMEFVREFERMGCPASMALNLAYPAAILKAAVVIAGFIKEQGPAAPKVKRKYTRRK